MSSHMKRVKLFLFFLSSNALVTQVASVTQGILIFDEEFESLTNWDHVVTAWVGKNEFQYFSPSAKNSYIKDSTLHMRPTLTADTFGEDFLFNGTIDLTDDGCNIKTDNGCLVSAGYDIVNPIQSARLTTKKSFSFTYGTIEVRAKMPRGDWIWPAIALLPTQEVYGSWPRSGDIVMAEIRGNDNWTCPNGQMGNSMMESSLDWGLNLFSNFDKNTTWHKSLKNDSFSSNFHIYRLEWLPTGMRFLVDDEEVGSLNPPDGGFWELMPSRDQLDKANNPWINGTLLAPFDQPFHFELNLAVGGDYFSDDCINADHPKPWNFFSSTPALDFWISKDDWYPTWSRNFDDSVMKVDYIRVYSI